MELASVCDEMRYIKTDNKHCLNLWEHPPIIKIYEALGAVADGRIEVNGNEAKIYSSSRNKFYVVSYDPSTESIMANDNGSFWKGYLGYPAIAFLMKTGTLPYEEEVGVLLMDIKWKDINQQFKNDFDKTLDFILSSKSEKEKEVLNQFASKVDTRIRELNLNILDPKVKPPEGY
jgi:hypothetical protein